MIYLHLKQQPASPKQLISTGDYKLHVAKIGSIFVNPKTFICFFSISLILVFMKSHEPIFVGCSCPEIIEK